MTKRPDHLFVSSTDGGLYDTRAPNWSHNRALRVNFERGHSVINTLGMLKASLRYGDFAWPGGYQRYYVTHDGAALCPDCVRKEWRNVVWDFVNKASTGWRIEASDYLEGDPDIEEFPYCDHCGERIGVDEEETDGEWKDWEN